MPKPRARKSKTVKPAKKSAKAARPAKAPAKAKIGRPTAYNPEMAKQAKNLAKFGATDREIAEALGVNERSIYRWAAEFPAFSQALKVGKAESDARVESSLYRRALGYSFDAVKFFQSGRKIIAQPYVERVAPDTTACIFWLKNRRPDMWREKQEIVHDFVTTPEQLRQARERSLSRPPSELLPASVRFAHVSEA